MTSYLIRRLLLIIPTVFLAISLLFFLFFTLLGSIASLGSVINFSDSMIFLMSLPNVIGLYLLANVIRSEFTHYHDRVKSGEIKEFAHRH